MPTNLYGPNDNYHPSESHVMASLIKKFIEAKDKNYPYVKCWGTGQPLREFLHVDDLAESIIFCLRMEKWERRRNKIKDLAQMIDSLDKPDGTPRKKISWIKEGIKKTIMQLYLNEVEKK